MDLADNIVGARRERANRNHVSTDAVAYNCRSDRSWERPANPDVLMLDVTANGGVRGRDGVNHADPNDRRRNRGYLASCERATRRTSQRSSNKS
jgi:hypothetical protein